MPDTCSPGSKKGDVRCLCGSLLARLVPGGVELKCRRCHRIRVIPLEDSPPLERAPETKSPPQPES
jgi:phage FluMu protein Com